MSFMIDYPNDYINPRPPLSEEEAAAIAEMIRAGEAEQQPAKPVRVLVYGIITVLVITWAAGVMLWLVRL